MLIVIALLILFLCLVVFLLDYKEKFIESRECSLGYVNIDGRCTQPCTHSFQCPPLDSDSNIVGECIKGGCAYTKAACQQDSDCAKNETCYYGTCDD